MVTYKTSNLLTIGVVVTFVTILGTTAPAFSFQLPRPITPPPPPPSPWGTTTTITTPTTPQTPRSNPAPRRTTSLQTSTANNNNDDDDQNDDDSTEPSPSLDEHDDDLDEPGTMRVAEIKSELRLRTVDHSDCFDKESLVQRLREARGAGKADPSILDRFNKQRLEDTFQERTLDLTDDVIDTARAADGSLPGGISPDILKELMANPELMALLQNPKMQDAMKLMMTGGQDSLERMMEDDDEMFDIVTKLNAIMNKVI